MDRDKLLELASRVEAAEGPDRELDAEIAHTTRWRWDGWEDGDIQIEDRPLEYVKERVVNPRNTIWEHLPRYTASLDAAMTLVPEGWRNYQADFSVRNRSRWMLEGPKTKWSLDSDGERCAGDDWYVSGVAPAPALALTAAALRALAQGDK